MSLMAAVRQIRRSTAAVVVALLFAGLLVLSCFWFMPDFVKVAFVQCAIGAIVAPVVAGAGALIALRAALAWDSEISTQANAADGILMATANRILIAGEKGYDTIKRWNRALRLVIREIFFNPDRR